MLKKNRITLIITTVIILIPMLVGVILWERLPDMIATHFGPNNEADGWTGKAFTVFGVPLIMLALQWVCVFAVQADPKTKNINPKMFTLTLWLVPIIAVVAMTAIFAIALEVSVNMEMICTVLLSVLMIVLGNYMPKCRQSYTVGYKLPWTLNDEGNWNATHRFAGWTMLIGGVILLISSPFAVSWIGFTVMTVIAFAPMVYSYVYYIRHK